MSEATATPIMAIRRKQLRSWIPGLLRLYKETGDEALKWPVVLRYTDLIKSAAIQVRGVYSSFAQVDDIVNEEFSPC